MDTGCTCRGRKDWLACLLGLQTEMVVPSSLLQHLFTFSKPGSLLYLYPSFFFFKSVELFKLTLRPRTSSSPTSKETLSYFPYPASLHKVHASPNARRVNLERDAALDVSVVCNFQGCYLQHTQHECCVLNVCQDYVTPSWMCTVNRCWHVSMLKRTQRVRRVTQISAIQQRQEGPWINAQAINPQCLHSFPGDCHSFNSGMLIAGTHMCSLKLAYSSMVWSYRGSIVLVVPGTSRLTFLSVMIVFYCAPSMQLLKYKSTPWFHCQRAVSTQTWLFGLMPTYVSTTGHKIMLQPKCGCVIQIPITAHHYALTQHNNILCRLCYAITVSAQQKHLLTKSVAQKPSGCSVMA